MAVDVTGVLGVSAGFQFFVSAQGSTQFFLRVAFVSFPTYSEPQEKIDWDPAWYADAEVVIVRKTDVGAIPRLLEIPHASLVAKAP